MPHLVEIEDPLDLEKLPPSPIGRLSPADYARDEANAHWAVLDGHRLMARCSLWWTSPPPYDGHRLGVVGHYAAGDAEAARLLLARACAVLASHRCTLAVGPMDGSTWRPYRLIIDRGQEPPFFMEPDNPDDWPAHFRGLGFLPLVHYRSALNDQLRALDRRSERLPRGVPTVPALERRFAATGVAIRSLDLGRLDEELHTIFSITNAAFGRSLLFKPIDEKEFVSRHRQLAAHINPNYVLIAERCGVPIGFCLGIPDWLQPERGEPLNTIILKSVAVVPGRSQAGLGRLLARRCEQRAAADGYHRSIHALMRDTSTSSNVSRDYTHTMRRYTLYCRPL